MNKVILTATVNPEERDLIKQLNDNIEAQTKLKFGVSLIISSLIAMLARKAVKERIERDILSRKKKQISASILKAANREIQRINGDNHDIHG